MASFVLCALLVTLAYAQFNLDNAIELNSYAGAAYCNASQLLAWDCLVCENSWARGMKVLSIITNLTSFESDTHGYIGISATDKIVVSFRGSHDIHQFITDFNFVKVPFNFPGAPSGLEVHQGFHNDFVSIYEQLMADFAAVVQKYPDYDVYVTGHSLGAALAAFASLYLQHAYPSKTIHHMTYGQPRVGNEPFAEFFDGFIAQNQTWRVTHYRDIVPHLAPESFGFYHIQNEAYQQEVFSGTMSSITLCYSGEDPSCADQWAAADSISDHLHYLGQPQGGEACCAGC